MIPVSRDVPPSPYDNPRHWVFLSEGGSLRRITPANPGADWLDVAGTLYRHTRAAADGRWVYTPEAA